MRIEMHFTVDLPESADMDFVSEYRHPADLIADWADSATARTQTTVDGEVVPELSTLELRRVK